jgi:hypothetical protein
MADSRYASVGGQVHHAPGVSVFVEKPIGKTKTQAGPVVNPGPYKRTIGAINDGVFISNMNESQAASQKIRPSRWFYLIALGLIAAGVICGYKFMATAISTMEVGLTQAVFPGEITVSFAAPGNYQIFYEEHSEFNGRVFDTGSRVPGLKFTVTNSETGEAIPLHRAAVSETYEVNGRSGRLVLQFLVAKPGSYKVAANYDDDQQHEDAVFAVGNVQFGRFTLLLLGGIFSIFGFGGAAVLVIVLIEVRRYSSKRKLHPATAIPGSIAPPPPL